MITFDTELPMGNFRPYTPRCGRSSHYRNRKTVTGGVGVAEGPGLGGPGETQLPGRSGLSPCLQPGFELVDELTRGAPGAPGVPAVPQEGLFAQALLGRFEAPLPREALDYAEVEFLVGGREGDAQAEAGREGLLLLHGVPGVDVVAVLPVGEALPDQVPAVGGRVDAHVFGRLLDAPLQERLERLVLDLVLLEGEVVHEEDKARSASPQGPEHPRQGAEVLLGDLDEPEPIAGELVEQRLHGGGLAGPGLAIEEGVMGRQPGQEAPRVIDQGLPLALVGYQAGEADRVGVGHGPQPLPVPPERPVHPEPPRAVPGEMVRQEVRRSPPVPRARALAGHRAAGGFLTRARRVPQGGPAPGAPRGAPPPPPAPPRRRAGGPPRRGGIPHPGAPGPPRGPRSRRAPARPPRPRGGVRPGA